MSSGRPASATPAANASCGIWIYRIARGPSDLVHRFGEREEFRPGQLVYLALVAVFRQRGDGDIGDVVHVDEWLSDVTGRKRDLTREDHVEELSFGEVLGEPAGAHNRPLDARTLDDQLTPLRLFLPATRQEDQPPDPVLHRSVDEGLDRIGRPRGWRGRGRS